MLSLYLGAAALSLCLVGATSGRRMSRPLAALALVALVLSLGRFAGLAPLVDAVPALRVLRFPVKAFFTVHFAVSLLASLGLAALAGEPSRAAWRRLGAVAGALGAVLALSATLPALLPGPLAAFGARFFPPGLDASARARMLERVLADAAAGGFLALLLCGTALAVLLGKLAPRIGVGLAVVVVAADLLRAGAGLNPMVPVPFFGVSRELSAALPSLREGRVFTCSLDESPAYVAARHARGGDHELWTFAGLQETLTPFSNLRFGVATALSPDLTMLVPEEQVLSPEEASCRDLDRIAPRLQLAGVRWVLSATELRHPDLALERTLAPARVAPLRVRVYETRRPSPLLEVTAVPPGGDPPAGRVVEAHRSTGRILAIVESDRPATLVVREGWARGWEGTVDGRPAALGRVPGGWTVPVPRGRSSVELRFRPPRLRGGLALSALALAATAGLLWPRRRPPGRS